MEAVTNGVDMHAESIGDGLRRTERLSKHEGGGEFSAFVAIIFQEWCEQSGSKGAQVSIEPGISQQALQPGGLYVE